MRGRNRSARRRPGFTLIELLVVIAIIGILILLTASAVFRLIGTQQGANTKSELSRLEGELQKQYRAATDRFAGEPIPDTGPYVNAAAVVKSMATVNGIYKRDLAQVIWVKLRLKQTFPNTFNEALNPYPMPANTNYANQLGLLGYNTANTTNPQPWESSACLLMALGRSEDGGGVRPEDIGVNSFIHDFGPTPSGGTVKGLIDGWGQPLAFCRWPVNSVVLNPPNGQPLSKANNDAVDPSGCLESQAWQSSGGYTLFLQYCHAVGQPPQGNQDATSYRVFPLIASPGPDKVLGLNPITFARQAATADDDLYPTLASPQ